MNFWICQQHLVHCLCKGLSPCWSKVTGPRSPRKFHKTNSVVIENKVIRCNLFWFESYSESISLSWTFRLFYCCQVYQFGICHYLWSDFHNSSANRIFQHILFIACARVWVSAGLGAPCMCSIQIGTLCEASNLVPLRISFAV